MNKEQLKKTLKPMIKECIKEVIFEEGIYQESSPRLLKAQAVEES